MRNKLNSKEIQERYGVSERTSYRWLQDDDHRVYEETYQHSEAQARAAVMLALRADLKELERCWCRVYIRTSAEAEKEGRDPFWTKLIELAETMWPHYRAFMIGSGYWPAPSPEDDDDDEEDDDQEEAEPTPETDTANPPSAIDTLTPGPLV